ncbi:hypothetical protein [Marinomonas sp.]
MNIRGIVETQLTQDSRAGKAVSGDAQFALFMSLFTQPGPPVMETNDELNQHQPHAITRPAYFSQGIANNPEANIALLKALAAEPLAEGSAYQYDAIANLENQISMRV